MQAGIGLAQIKKINKFVNKEEVAKKYKKKLKNIEGISYLLLKLQECILFLSNTNKQKR